VASSTEMSGVVGPRRWSAAGRRRSSFSVPRSGSEAQGAKERRKKKVLWARGKKSKSSPVPVFIPRDPGRGGRGKCSTTPTVSAAGRHVAVRSGVAVTVTVPLGNDGEQ
jgi:hypothetical protein